MHWLLLSVLLFPSFAAAAEQPVPGDDLLDYLGELIGWHRDASALARSPVNSRETLFRDPLRKTSSQALRSAFQFARAQAALPLTNGAAAPEDTKSRNLAQAVANAEQRIEQLQAEINDLNRRLPNLPERGRANAIVKRDKLSAELNLAKARREAVQGLLALLTGSGGGGLAGKINDLERSVPEMEAASGAREPALEFHPESAGIVGLTTDVFEISGKMSRLNKLALTTEQLRQSAEKLRLPLRNSLIEVIRRSDEISKLPETDDSAELASERKELDALLARFKQLSGMSAPLAQQIAQLNAARADLLQWRAELGEEHSSALRYLLLRLGMLAFGLLIIFLFSELWRRGTMRYVQDIRRRRQFLLLRRIVVGFTIAIFVVLSFVTEFGSIATFAGFSAAGIALAMQSVILSVVAYFFLVGRWGVRVGDRITVSGVTGDVIDIGLFRLYLMELGKVGADFHPTGRIVVFPNAVFFQPSALFKQFPGIDYSWRIVSITVSPGSDYQAAEQALLAAVESVYAEYRESIERQHQAAQSANNLHIATPRPETLLRLVDGGVEFSVRYPVEIPRAAEIDDRITRELIAAIERSPSLSAASVPKVQATA